MHMLMKCFGIFTMLRKEMVTGSLVNPFNEKLKALLSHSFIATLQTMSLQVNFKAITHERPLQCKYTIACHSITKVTSEWSMDSQATIETFKPCSKNIYKGTGFQPIEKRQLNTDK